MKLKLRAPPHAPVHSQAARCLPRRSGQPGASSRWRVHVHGFPVGVSALCRPPRFTFSISSADSDVRVRSFSATFFPARRRSAPLTLKCPSPADRAGQRRAPADYEPGACASSRWPRPLIADYRILLGLVVAHGLLLVGTVVGVSGVHDRNRARARRGPRGIGYWGLSSCCRDCRRRRRGRFLHFTIWVGVVLRRLRRVEPGHDWGFRVGPDGSMFEPHSPPLTSGAVRRVARGLPAAARARRLRPQLVPLCSATGGITSFTARLCACERRHAKGLPPHVPALVIPVTRPMSGRGWRSRRTSGVPCLPCSYLRLACLAFGGNREPG